jgi:hypothetical protein
MISLLDQLSHRRIKALNTLSVRFVLSIEYQTLQMGTYGTQFIFQRGTYAAEFIFRAASSVVK